MYFVIRVDRAHPIRFINDDFMSPLGGRRRRSSFNRGLCACTRFGSIFIPAELIAGFRRIWRNFVAEGLINLTFDRGEKGRPALVPPFLKTVLRTRKVRVSVGEGQKWQKADKGDQKSGQKCQKKWGQSRMVEEKKEPAQVSFKV